ncbi:uncharacterized protein METZ01_LOCUS300303, partial [marine metagenome]
MLGHARFVGSDRWPASTGSGPSRRASVRPLPVGPAGPLVRLWTESR